MPLQSAHLPLSKGEAFWVAPAVAEKVKSTRGNCIYYGIIGVRDESEILAFMQNLFVYNER